MESDAEIPVYVTIKDMVDDIVGWASGTFPNRDFHVVQRKLAMCEIPELVIALGSGDKEAIAGEVADNVILLVDVCEQLGIDFAQVVHKKLQTNKGRQWTIDKHGMSQHVKSDE